MEHSQNLTKRERGVLFLIAMEYSTPEIANLLHLSPYTIISHRKSIQRKLNARNTAGMIYKAFQRGLLKEQRMLVNNT